MLSAAPQQDRIARLAGFAAVLALHGALLYSLWHYRILPPPAAAATLFVNLLNDPPKPPPEPPKPKPPKLQPVKLEQPRPPEPPSPQQLVAQAPVVSPAEPVASLPPPAPVKIEAPPEPASPPKPAGPVVMSGDLAVSCPQRNAPTYPSISRRLGEEGKVVLRVELDEGGQIDRAAIRSSSGFVRLDEAALAAVKHWRCDPAMRDGMAVRAVALQPFNFVLEGK
jgi:protein TonB